MNSLRVKGHMMFMETVHRARKKFNFPHSSNSNHIKFPTKIVDKKGYQMWPKM